MPEFHLDTGGTDSHRTFDALPDFTRGYIEAAFFCGVELPDGDRDESDAFSLDDLHPDALAEMAGDCAAFMAAHAADLATLDGAEWDGAASWGAYDMTDAGRDYWFTRNGHGVGFWDRSFTGEAADAAERLTDACRYSETYIYQGDDSKVHADSAGYVEAGRAIIEAAKADPDALPVVGGRYGAPMGRGGDVLDPDAGPLTARRVTLDAGGYDAGGAYWGQGAPLWRVTDADGATDYVRAATESDAIAAIRAS